VLCSLARIRERERERGSCIKKGGRTAEEHTDGDDKLKMILQTPENGG